MSFGLKRHGARRMRRDGLGLGNDTPEDSDEQQLPATELGPSGGQTTDRARLRKPSVPVAGPPESPIGEAATRGAMSQALYGEGHGVVLGTNKSGPTPSETPSAAETDAGQRGTRRAESPTPPALEHGGFGSRVQVSGSGGRPQGDTKDAAGGPGPARTFSGFMIHLDAETLVLRLSMDQGQ